VRLTETRTPQQRRRRPLPHKIYPCSSVQLSEPCRLSLRYLVLICTDGVHTLGSHDLLHLRRKKATKCRYASDWRMVCRWGIALRPTRNLYIVINLGNAMYSFEFCAFLLITQKTLGNEVRRNLPKLTRHQAPRISAIMPIFEN
jgi:hypothetical protein